MTDFLPPSLEGVPLGQATPSGMRLDFAMRDEHGEPIVYPHQLAQPESRALVVQRPADLRRLVGTMRRNEAKQEQTLRARVERMLRGSHFWIGIITATAIIGLLAAIAGSKRP